jgi:endonuclease/exonuclease/phosphatase family metal-dependent hydrolase
LFRQLLLISIILSLVAVEDLFAQETSEASNFQRQHDVDLRVMCWNVRIDSVVPPNGVRSSSFVRIVRAMNPDLIALQEVMRPDSVEKIKSLLDSQLPLSDGASWSVHSVADNMLISRFPLQRTGGELVFKYPYPNLGLPNFHYGYAAALVKRPEDHNDLGFYVIAMHNKSRLGEENERLRQLQSDSIASWIRKARDAGSPMALASGTPIIILGDMNVIPNASLQPFETLITGNILDEAKFGPDFEIDWDGTDLADAKPSINGQGEYFYTWRYDDTQFDPGALDRVIYTDSVLTVKQSIVLDTTTISDEDLSSLGLLKSDVLFGGEPGFFDHFPLIVDFSARLEAID